MSGYRFAAPPDLGSAGTDSDPLWFAKDLNISEVLMRPAILIVVVGFAIWVYLQNKAARGVGAVPGGLNYVTGPMGSGKTMYGVVKIVAALREGKYVVTNVRLVGGWQQRVAAKYWPRAKRAEAVRLMEGLYIYEPSLRKAMRYRPPCAVCGGPVRICCGEDVPIERSHSGPKQEARALMVWDESHNDLNNRDWDAGTVSDREVRAYEKRMKALMITWGTQLRKIGFVGYLLSQHHENTDAQLRRISNHLIKCQNQRNAGGFGALLPRRLARFLVYWYPTHMGDGSDRGGAASVRRDAYFLPKLEKSLYDSWETYHGLDAGEDEETTPIDLPAPSSFLRPRVPALSAAAEAGAAPSQAR